ncbi:MAG: hypothetical protein ABSE73_19320 [Planctomycetota bacterium]
MEVLFVLGLMGGLIKFMTSGGSSSPPAKSTKSAAQAAADSGAVAKQTYDYIAACQALESQVGAERQAVMSEFHRDMDEFLRARRTGAPIPDRLLRGSFPQRLRIMAEKQRREQQAQGSGSSQQN